MVLSNKNKTRIFYISMAVLFLLFISFVRGIRHLLIQKHEITNCFIDEIKTVGREQSVRIKYHFFVDGRLHNSDVAFGQKYMSYENFKSLKNKEVPVAYHYKFGVMVSYILIFPDDYADFNIPFPDSLKWILPLIKN